jgi:16S rRNA (guanine527-N7)-methyltransferase
MGSKPEINNEAINLLRECATLIGVPLETSALATLSSYAGRLIEANKTMNLTAIDDPEAIVIKHFLDSLTLVSFLPKETKTLADVGAGAGFPGIPIAIARPDIKVVLIESISKKALFLERLIDDLELPNVAVVCARAEDAGRHPDMREAFDCACARAVAETSVLAEYLLPLTRVGGTVLLQKSAEARTEIDKGAAAITTIGGTLRRIDKVEVSPLEKSFKQAAEQLSGRVVVTIEKTSPTSETYPRRAGTPKKEPVL